MAIGALNLHVRHSREVKGSITLCKSAKNRKLLDTNKVLT